MILEHQRYGFLSRMMRPEGVAPKVTIDNVRRLGISPGMLSEISLSSSLLITIIAFLFFPHVEGKQRIVVRSQETVAIEEIERTKQENRPPPPPRPAIPIEAPGDEALSDVDLASTELNVGEEVAPPPAVNGDEDEQYFVAVEDMPQIIGGTEAIMRVLQYPDLAVRAGVQGRVYVMAFVNEYGEVTKTQLIKGIGAGCDEAAMAAVQKTRFIPGKQRGKAVKVRVSIPVVFRLRGST